ncbi:ATP-binding protein [candidate division KSB1 bacterium]|nr:ATP-binding protein [candidate division KSB1 bacterium]
MIDYTIFQNQNRWRSDSDYFKRQTFLKRHVFKELIKWIDDEEMIVISGSRQVGKSTLMLMLIQHLLDVKKCAATNIFYFNLDERSLHPLFQSTSLLIDFLKPGSNQEKKYLFIDEFQKIPDAGNFMKALFDLKLPMKIIVSGSSSLEIAKDKEMLTGRKQVFFIYPFSFEEFIEYENPELARIENLQLTKTNLQQFFLKYMTYGGYPRILLENNIEKKALKLKEIHSSYLEKDILNLIKIDNIEKFNKLIYLLASQVGNLVNKNEISSTLALNMATTERYLSILSGTYIFDYVSPYFNNPRKEISKMPKVYINDLGLKNIIETQGFILRETGSMVENFVHNELKIKLKEKLKFWRTQTKAEVDFIIDQGKSVIPIEVKYTERKPDITGGLLSFYKKYQPQRILMITKDYFLTESYETAIIEYVPVYALNRISIFK